MELRNSSVGELLLITGFSFPCNWNNVHLGMFPLPNHHLQWHHTTIYPNSYPWFSPDYPMKNHNVCYLNPDFLWLNPYSFLDEICNCSSNNSRQSMLRMQPVRDSINPEAEEYGCGSAKIPWIGEVKGCGKPTGLHIIFTGESFSILSLGRRAWMF